MKKVYLIIICGLLCVANIHAQTVVSGTTGPLAWEIAGPVGAYTLTISGTGDMPNYGSGNAPWYGYRTTITSVNIGANITAIGAYAFYNCTGFSSITIPNNAVTIGASAFYGCSGLVSAAIPNNVTTIGASAFVNCSRLSAVTIGSGVNSVVYSMFTGCSDLTAINVSAGNANYSSVDGVLFNKSATNLILYPAGRQGAYSISGGVTAIGTYSFQNCSGLTAVTIPASVTSIGAYAFSSCAGLRAVTVQWAAPLSIAATVFNGCATNYIVLAAPQSSIATYQAAAVWSGFYFQGVSLPPSGTCGASLAWAYDMAGTLTISGSGAMTDFTTDARPPWYDMRAKIQTAIMPAGMTTVGNYAFQNCSSLTSANIPNSLTTIGTYAFSGCSSLASITIPELITSMGSYAFQNCTGLLTVIFNAKNCASMSSNTFQGCTNLTTVNIGDEVTAIPANAFSGCTILKSVTIGNSVTSIGSSAFSGCSGLKSITISEQITTVGSSAFQNCSELTTVNYNARNCTIGSSIFTGCSKYIVLNVGSEVTAIPANVYSNSLTAINVNIANAAYSSDDGVLLNQTKTELIKYPVGKTDTDYTIPASVTSVLASAFSGSTELTQVTITEAVTSIGSSAFQNCTGLTKIDFFAINCATMGSGVFYNCPNLTNLEIGWEVTVIPANAFSGCSSLRSVFVPIIVALKTIGAYAFSGCAITTFNISASVTSVGSGAFQNCSELHTVDFYANNCTTMGSNVFYGCAKLSSLNIGSVVTTIPAGAFTGLPALWRVIIPEAVTSIGNGAFSNCAELQTVYFNARNCTIGSNMFSGCAKLTQLNIGNEVTTIPASAFYGCTGLTTVTIPETVTTVGNEAFRNCSELTTVNFNARNCATMNGSSVFQGCGSLSGLTIGNSVKTIPANAFSGLIGIVDVTIPEAVEYIGNNAFSGCTALSSVYFNAVNCTYMGDNASNMQIFYNCPKFTNLYIGNEVTAIPALAFRSGYNSNNSSLVHNIRSVTLPVSVKTIGSFAFADCRELAEIINHSATPQTINASVFDGVDKDLCTLYVPAGSEVLYRASTAIGWRDFMNIGIYRPVTSVRLNQSAITFAIGETSVLETIIEPADATTKGVQWKSSNPDVASVTGTGVIFGMFAGTAEITATTADGGFEASCTVTVSGGLPLIDKGVSGSVIWMLRDNAPAQGYTLIVHGTAIPDYSTGGAPWYKHRSSITAVVIGSEVTAIGAYAFQGCTEIETVTIHEGVTSIGNLAFYGCTGLKTVNFNAVNLTKMGSWSYSEWLGSPTISDATVFDGCDQLATVNFGNRVTIIPDYAFYKCYSLTSFTIPETVEYLGTRAFNGVPVAEVTIPEGLKIIGSGAFGYCSSLVTLKFNAINCVAKESDEWGGTSGLTTYYYCHNSAFEGCSIVNHLTVGSRVTVIPHKAFDELTGLLSIQVDAGNAAYSSENDVLFNKSKTELIRYAAHKPDLEYVIPSSVTTVKIYAFRGCSKLTTVTIHEAVEYLGLNVFLNCTALATVNFNAVNCTFFGAAPSLSITGNCDPYYGPAFEGCSSFTNINIGNNVTHIPGSSFYNCTRLTSVTIPASVKSIGDFAFKNCTGLYEITNYATTPQPLDENARFGHVFYEVNQSACMLYVPAGTATAYQKAPVWRNFRIEDNLPALPVITINTQPAANTTVTQGSISGSLSVSASVTQDATLSYQWYENATGSNVGGAMVPGAINATFAIPTALAAGTYYYFCELSATGAASVRSGVATVTVTIPDIPAAVTEITVTPATVSVQKGTTQQFTVNVTIQGGASTDVAWSVSGKTSAETGINASGLLAVAAGETATTLTVTATSVFDNTKKGAASVTLTEIPVVTEITVTPATVSVQKGTTQQFTVNVTTQGGASTDVAWTVSDKTSAETGINASGLLAVAVDETATTLIVTATSVFDNTKYGAATVTVTSATTPDMLLQSIIQPSAITGLPNGAAKTATAFGLPASVTMVTDQGNVSATVDWNVADCSYNPALTTAQTFSVNGTIALPQGVVNTNAVSLTVTISVTVNAVLLNPHILSVVVTPNTVSVQKGQSYQFDVTVTAVDGADESVAWSVTGNALTATGINTTGLLSIAAGETATAITVRATSVHDAGKYGEATVTVSHETVTGTEDVFAPDLKIYPNPFTGEVRIIGAVETWRAASLQITNAAGVPVHAQMLANPDEIIRLEHLPAGVYFFRLEKDGKAKTIKVVKQ